MKDIFLFGKGLRLKTLIICGVSLQQLFAQNDKEQMIPGLGRIILDIGSGNELFVPASDSEGGVTLSDIDIFDNYEDNEKERVMTYVPFDLNFVSITFGSIDVFLRLIGNISAGVPIYVDDDCGLITTLDEYVTHAHNIYRCNK